MAKATKKAEREAQSWQVIGQDQAEQCWMSNVRPVGELPFAYQYEGDDGDQHETLPASVNRKNLMAA